ncbi:MAG: 3-phosphoshikimate 1-carboxyvinyltransferase [Planctomycetota bacterium]|nr:MAG: 3-phosphoshikimate 1-carboxyvinyltransferase [Planctomycetota bacterium]
MREVYEVPTCRGPIDARVRPPGSKSLTNRALVVSALADGVSRLTNVLDCDDTRVMLDSLQALGIRVEENSRESSVIVYGCGGRIPAEAADLWLQNSGTSIRFLTAMCALGNGDFRLDGNARMRQRPIGPLVDALNQLGVNAECILQTGCPPVLVQGAGLSGGTASISGRVSSQFLSALLMAAPGARDAVTLECRDGLVSRPYVDMTIGVMARFGVSVEVQEERRFLVEPQTYQAAEYAIEPDASAASYFFAVAAITQGRVTVEGLSLHSLQGDIRFVEALEQMGCRVDWEADSTTVTGGPLRGIEIDMNEISDTAQTLAVVAAFAEGPTRIYNVGHMRHKETDRLAAMATEFRRVGLRVDEEPDAITIHPGTIRPATIQTYDDHRMAMSFALLGLRVPGIRIGDPQCTRKTYPGFFRDLERVIGC